MKIMRNLVIHSPVYKMSIFTKCSLLSEQHTHKCVRDHLDLYIFDIEYII